MEARDQTRGTRGGKLTQTLPHPLHEMTARVPVWPTSITAHTDAKATKVVDCPAAEAGLVTFLDSMCSASTWMQGRFLWSRLLVSCKAPGCESSYRTAATFVHTQPEQHRMPHSIRTLRARARLPRAPEELAAPSRVASVPRMELNSMEGWTLYNRQHRLHDIWALMGHGPPLLRKGRYSSLGREGAPELFSEPAFWSRASTHNLPWALRFRWSKRRAIPFEAASSCGPSR